ncbi:general odorant-binding protein 69a [Galleria mellonella]|uniref:Odorant-binding protein n=1 Tax=Galleria mellonella TaxID=7137 RepID=A0A5C0E3D6_GALME|nr:general odorant-binding protein 69a [Galleria mellonella]QEI46794.1 odorant-binding protein 10 [Galleria mellonella]QID58971.1 odorant-binding protein [Galleria mellonella]
MEARAAVRCALVGLLLALGVTAIDDDMAELIKMVHDSCGEETGVDFGLVDKVNAGADLMPDPKLKCYIKCLMVTGGMMSDGEVDIDAVLTLLPENIGKKNEPLLRGCGTKKGADDCDTAFLTQVCWQNANKADYFLI